MVIMTICTSSASHYGCLHPQVWFQLQIVVDLPSNTIYQILSSQPFQNLVSQLHFVINQPELNLQNLTDFRRIIHSEHVTLSFAKSQGGVDGISCLFLPFLVDKFI